MIEARIRSLSVALEALSRINGYDASNHFGNVSLLLEAAIAEAREQHEARKAAKHKYHTDSADTDDIQF